MVSLSFKRNKSQKILKKVLLIIENNMDTKIRRSMTITITTTDEKINPIN